MARGIGKTKLKKKKTGLMENIDYGNEVHEQVVKTFRGILRKKKKKHKN